MYVKLKNQKDLLQEAIDRCGSYRKLAKKLQIPGSSLLEYKNEKVIPFGRFEKISKFLGLKDIEKLIKEKLEDNFKQIIGGKKCVLAKKKKGTFERDMKRIQKIQSEKLKKWHKMMKKEKPEEYYKIQYSRFKKIAGYKYKTKRGEKVRNLFEKQVADILYSLGFNYKYEPLVKSKGKYFFPDFLINKNIIIECTAWRGEAKAYKIKDKIKYLKDNFKIFVVIPKHLYRYYKILDYHLVVGLDALAPVAQTFLSAKTKRKEQ